MPKPGDACASDILPIGVYFVWAFLNAKGSEGISPVVIAISPHSQLILAGWNAFLGDLAAIVVMRARVGAHVTPRIAIQIFFGRAFGHALPGLIVGERVGGALFNALIGRVVGIIAQRARLDAPASSGVTVRIVGGNVGAPSNAGAGVGVRELTRDCAVEHAHMIV